MIGWEELNSLKRKTADMKPELRECPWCGNKKPVLDVDVVDGEAAYFVDCKVYACDRETVEYFETPEKAIEAWNSREGSEIRKWAKIGEEFSERLTAGLEEMGQTAEKTAKAIEELSDEIWKMMADEFNVPLEVLQKFRGSEEETLKRLLGIVSPTKKMEDCIKELYDNPMIDGINDPRIDKITTG